MFGIPDLVADCAAPVAAGAGGGGVVRIYRGMERFFGAAGVSVSQAAIYAVAGVAVFSIGRRRYDVGVVDDRVIFGDAAGDSAILPGAADVYSRDCHDGDQG